MTTRPLRWAHWLPDPSSDRNIYVFYVLGWEGPPRPTAVVNEDAQRIVVSLNVAEQVFEPMARVIRFHQVPLRTLVGSRLLVDGKTMKARPQLGRGKQCPDAGMMWRCAARAGLVPNQADLDTP